MEKVFGPLGVLALVLGGVQALQYLEGKQMQDAIYGASLIGSGLSLLAVFEIIRVLKQIRDGVKPD
jgi:hypothetical protein